MFAARNAFLTAGLAGPEGDLYWDYTSLLLTAGDGTGATNSTFLDSSANNLTVTRFGDVTQGLVSPVSGGGSAYFDGSGDRLEIPSSTGFAFGTGDYCIELWVRPDAWPSGYYDPLIRTIGGAKGFIICNHYGNLLYHIPNVGDILTASLPTVGAWSHIAVCRNGTTLSMFVNGTRVATTTNSHNHVAANLAIGGSTDWNTYSKGHITEVRIVKGNSIYDPTQATLTPPTEPLTAIPGTSLLLNMNNASIVDRTAKNTFAVFGDAQASAVETKFASRSIYFDGSGDYLSLPDSPSLQMGTGDFTIECFWYPTAFNSYSCLFDKGYTSGLLLQANSGVANVYVGGTLFTVNSTPFTAGSWHHVALVRSGSTVTLYANGVAVGSTTSTANLNQTGNFWIGRDNNGSASTHLYGYIDGLRATKGVARYTANFTPPTGAFPVGP